MSKVKAHLVLAVLAVLSAACTYSASAAEEIRTECVGRFTVSLPVAGNFALTPRQNFLHLYLDKPSGDYDEHATIGIDPVEFIKVSAPTTLKDFNKLRFEIKALEEKYRKEVELGPTSVIVMSEYPVDIPDAFAWQEGQTGVVQLYLYRGGRIYLRTVDASKRLSDAEAANRPLKELIDPKLVAPRIADFVKRFHPRNTFEIPKEPGVCFPYGFIADADDSVPKLHQDLFNSSSVVVEMQLFDHPDVVILFEQGIHGNSSFYVGGGKPPIEQIWELRLAYDTKAVHLGLPQFHSFTMGGWLAQWGFGEMIHFDETTDYGYAAAAVNEDKTSPEFEDSLSLIVVRHAARAKGKPVSKGELKELAEKIAASVARR